MYFQLKTTWFVPTNLSTTVLKRHAPAIAVKHPQKHGEQKTLKLVSPKRVTLARSDSHFYRVFDIPRPRRRSQNHYVAVGFGHLCHPASSSFSLWHHFPLFLSLWKGVKKQRQINNLWVLFEGDWLGSRWTTLFPSSERALQSFFFSTFVRILAIYQTVLNSIYSEGGRIFSAGKALHVLKREKIGNV